MEARQIDVVSTERDEQDVASSPRRLTNVSRYNSKARTPVWPVYTWKMWIGRGEMKTTDEGRRKAVEPNVGLQYHHVQVVLSWSNMICF